MTVTFYKPSRYVMDALEEFEIAYADPTAIKVVSVDNIDIEEKRIRLHTYDNGNRESHTAIVDNRLYTYIDIVPIA